MAEYKNNLNSHVINNADKIQQKTHEFNGCIPSTMDNAFHSFEIIEEIANYLLKHTKVRPLVGIICGSGLNSIGDHLKDFDIFPYETIPHFPISTVEGHVGRMVFGYLSDVPVMCMQGRFHYYEGYTLPKCSIPIRVMKLIGIKYLIVTNAAGGVNPKYKIGDIMIIKDHINIMGISGNNPLQGSNDNRFGPRFLSMVGAYDRNLIKIAKKIAKDMKFDKNLHEGVFTCCAGPNYETVAEVRMLKLWGIDAVGMSTVHEVMIAKHCDMKVFAFSLITNCCPLNYDSDDENMETNHDDVVEVGKSRQNVCIELVEGIVKGIRELEKMN